jgi:hypothetical protein
MNRGSLSHSSAQDCPARLALKASSLTALFGGLIYLSFTSPTISLTISSSEAHRKFWCSTGSRTTSSVFCTSISKMIFSHVFLSSPNVNCVTFLSRRVASRPASSFSSRAAASRIVSSVSSTFPPGISCILSIHAALRTRRCYYRPCMDVFATHPKVWKRLLISCTLH